MPLCGGTGGGRLRTCWILVFQSANPLSFCHHYLAVIGRTSLTQGASHAVSIFSYLCLVTCSTLLCFATRAIRLIYYYSSVFKQHFYKNNPTVDG
ncbi:hypothetical protein EGS47_02865 [Acinetobacter sp. FDAARGOS_515]|nr:hypothetical protein EGS47_02865 [Acinetobacter sp. FDAARGOS_515]